MKFDASTQSRTARTYDHLQSVIIPAPLIPSRIFAIWKEW